MKNIKATTAQLASTPAVQGTFLFCRVGYRLALTVVPAIVAAYLLLNFDDMVITVIAAGLIIFSILKLVNSAYRAEALASKKRK